MAQIEVIDPTTRSGFLALAESHGRTAAHSARIRALEARIEACSGFRWHDRNPRRALETALFEAAWEAGNPDKARVMREAGMGY